jgi:methyl-accepting chemotaxis protein
MKNISLAAKITILVAVLVISGGTIAVVGIRQLAKSHDQLQTLVDRDSDAIIMASGMRIELLRAVRSEKNAVLARDKSQSAEWAAKASQAAQKLNQLRADIAHLVDANTASSEGKALADFDRAVDDFGKNQKDVLRLAVVKSNADGKAILNKELHTRAHDLEEFVAGLSEPVASEAAATTRAADDGRQTAKAVAGSNLMERLYDLLYHLDLHLDSSQESEMNQMDGEIRPRVIAFQEALRHLSVMLNESERSRGSSVLAAMETIKPLAKRIQELSHANTDLGAVELTITKTVEVGDRCDTALAELIGALDARLDGQMRIANENYAFGRIAIASTGGVGLLISLVLATVIIRSITRPVAHGVRVFESLAAGNLTQRMSFDRHDEIGRLGAASDHMATTLCDVVTQIRSLAGRLGESAGQLSGVSHDLLAQSHEMATQAESVAAGTEQTSSNVASMAAAAEQMSVNVAGISSASEEVSVNVAAIAASAESASHKVGSVAESIAQITASLQGVAVDARQGSHMTQQARDMATNANQAMRQLDQAASEITKVTDVIKSIALQTNLLALNATIEATSAGEAGKGFAVVAGEIKELANQSGQSAEEIARKIESVQASTREAVKVIEDVARFIGEVNVSAGRISEAVNLQTGTADRIAADVAQTRKGVEDIARSIAEVAKGANDVSGNTAEAAKAANEVSRNAAEAAEAAQVISSNIHGVCEATRQNNSSAVQVDETARRLNEIAAQLQRGVAHFNTGAPAQTTSNA